MICHPSRYLVEENIRHKNSRNLKLHLWTTNIRWLAMTSLFSEVPLPFGIPMLGSNLGAAFVAVSLLYWLSLDVITALLVAAMTVAWAALPFSTWGPGGSVVSGVALPIATFIATTLAERLSHIYYHEHPTFIGGGSASHAVLFKSHAVIWGAFHHWLQTLLRWGYRPRLRASLDDSERELQQRESAVPWQNWAGLVSTEARVVCVPRTIPELVLAVSDAFARGKGVRVVGSGFSWSSLVPSDDTLIFCERLDRVSVDASDPARPTVWAEAGVTNRQLNEELARFGLCMPWNVVLETVRVAGIASTGTHGTGQHTATVGDLVEAFEVVDSEGRLRVLSENTVGAEVMSAARLGLGLFGVIARVKLSVAHAYRVCQTDRRLNMSHVLENLPELIHGHDSVELFWFPFNRDMWVRTIDRTDEARTFQGHGFWFKTQNLLQNGWLVIFSKLVMRLAPSLTPALLRFGIRMLPFRARVLDLQESHHYHHWIEMMPAGCMEVGFKLDPDCANVRRACEATERLVLDYAKRGLYPLNLSLNVRFTGPSTALLTPAYGAGLTCYVEIMWLGRPKGWAEFSSDLCREWLKVPGALPHWSKEFEHVEGVIPIIRASLGERLVRFLEALDQSGLDPQRRFWNPLTRRVLGDAPRAT